MDTHTFKYCLWLLSHYKEVTEIKRSAKPKIFTIWPFPLSLPTLNISHEKLFKISEYLFTFSHRGSAGQMFGLTVTMAWSCIRMHGFRCELQLPILASFQHRLWEVMIKVAGSLRRSYGRPRMSSQQPASVRPSPSQWWREITLSLCDLRTRENNDMPVRPVLSLLPSNHTCLIAAIEGVSSKRRISSSAFQVNWDLQTWG